MPANRSGQRLPVYTPADHVPYGPDDDATFFSTPLEISHTKLASVRSFDPARAAYLERNKFVSASGMDTQDGEMFQNQFGIQRFMFFRYDHYTRTRYTDIAHNLCVVKNRPVTTASFTGVLRANNFFVAPAPVDDARKHTALDDEGGICVRAN